jgi:uncharacterized membrane protein
MKLGDFGPLVIFAAIYAAGSLGLPPLSFLAYQVKVGEMASAFVAIFGFPAVLGLTLGQFIANLGVEAKPIAMISPIISFAGLLFIYYMRKINTLAGCLVYVVVTSIWLSLTLPILNPEVSSSLSALSAFAGQFIAVMVGYVGYLLARRTVSNPTQVPALPSESNPDAMLGRADGASV